MYEYYSSLVTIHNVLVGRVLVQVALPLARFLYEGYQQVEGGLGLLPAQV